MTDDKINVELSKDSFTYTLNIFYENKNSSINGIVVRNPKKDIPEIIEKLKKNT